MYSGGRELVFRLRYVYPTLLYAHTPTFASVSSVLEFTIVFRVVFEYPEVFGGAMAYNPFENTFNLERRRSVA
jgi:hypothetical protein